MYPFHRRCRLISPALLQTGRVHTQHTMPGISDLGTFPKRTRCTRKNQLLQHMSLDYTVNTMLFQHLLEIFLQRNLYIHQHYVGRFYLLGM